MLKKGKEMNQTIRDTDFSKAIKDILDEYGDEVREAMSETSEEIAKETVAKMKSSGSFGGSGAYKKTWSKSVESKRTNVEMIVHNTKHGQLTHLLEYGHAKTNGGRTRAFPHIAPVNDWAQTEFINVLERKLKK